MSSVKSEFLFNLPSLFNIVDLFDHLALIFLCWPILLIKMVITHKWWLINYRLSISITTRTEVTRSRQHIWIIIPWRIIIMNIKVRSHGIDIGDPCEGNDIDLWQLLHCWFWLWNFSLREDFGRLDRLAWLTIGFKM
jgi:hypothetical protein